MISQGIKVLLQITSMMMLARLLTPADYGAFGIVSAVTGLGLVIKDMGFAAATLNSPALSQKQVSNVFWITVLANTVLAAITCALAPLVAQIYHNTSLILPIVAMACSFIVLAFGSQHYSLLRRQMRFKILAAIDVLSLVSGVAVAVFTAQFRGEVWALVNMQLSISVVATALVWYFCKWRPSLPNRNEDISSLREFGRQILSFQLMDYAVRNIDNLLVGKFCGPQVLGFYDRAFQLHMIPSQNICWPFGAVLLGTLSRAHSDKIRFARLSTLTVFTTAAICMPMVAFLFVKSPQIVAVLLGSQWNESATVFRALAPAAFFECVLISLGWIFMAAKQGNRLLRCNVAQFIVTIASFFVGIRAGAFGVALALSFTRILSLVPTVFYCKKNSDLSACALLTACAEPMFTSLISALVISFLRATSSSIASLLVDGILFSICYSALLLCCPTTRKLWLAIKGRDEFSLAT